MDVFRLNSKTTFNSTADYKPAALVEGFSSKIWTERFRESGEFEFRSPNIIETITALPEGSLISLRDTSEVMMVESHSIEDEGSGHILVTKGRSIDSFLESRVYAGAAYGKKRKTQRGYTVTELLIAYLWEAIVNDTGKTVLSATGHDISVDNVLENVSVTTDWDPNTGPTKVRWIENSDCLTFLRNWFAAYNFGLRGIRPKPSNGLAQRYRVGPAGVVYPYTPGTTSTLQYNFYKGINRTQSQTINPSVVFSYNEGHLDDPKYLFSSQAYRSTALVISGSGPWYGDEYIRTPGSGGTGYPGSGIAPGEPGTGGIVLNTSWARKVGLVDAGSKDDGDTNAEFLDTLDDVAQNALAKDLNRTTLIDATVSIDSPYVYKTHYDLGDKVTLLGQYKIKQNMVVNEFVRTEDSEGERGFPGLTLWT